MNGSRWEGGKYRGLVAWLVLCKFGVFFPFTFLSFCLLVFLGHLRCNEYADLRGARMGYGLDWTGTGTRWISSGRVGTGGEGGRGRRDWKEFGLMRAHSIGRVFSQVLQGKDWIGLDWIGKHFFLLYNLLGSSISTPPNCLEQPPPPIYFRWLKFEHLEALKKRIV